MKPPDFVIGPADNPYLYRWFLLPRNPVANVYLHRFFRDDEDRALHDHPWPFLSIVLDAVGRPLPCRTPVITGPRVREWGFWCPQGFVPWKIFTKPNSPGEIGRGCGDV